jgi:copper chaperone CopZ
MDPFMREVLIVIITASVLGVGFLIKFLISTISNKVDKTTCERCAKTKEENVKELKTEVKDLRTTFDTRSSDVVEGVNAMVKAVEDFTRTKKR